MFVPINVLIRPKTMTAKTRMIKYTYYFIGCTYLLGNSWIFNWIITMLTGVGSNFDISAFQYHNGYMFTHLAWGLRNELGAFMNIFIGIWIPKLTEHIR